MHEFTEGSVEAERKGAGEGVREGGREKWRMRQRD